MFRVKVLKNEVVNFGATFETELEAQAWIEKCESKGNWGKKEIIMTVAKVVTPMELIEEVKGPMGIKVFKVRIPADYEVVLEEILPEPRDLTKEIQAILLATDWLFISDVPMPSNFRVMFKDYRQMLRTLKKRAAEIETFEAWLRRTRPEYFKDGGNGLEMIKKFNTYLE